MATVKRILCLANSRKLHGRCIAGIELTADNRAGGWIRPVSAREHEEVSEYERQYEDGSDPQVLDVMNVPLLEPRPKAFQQENWLLDPGHYWERTSRARWTALQKLVGPDSPLWINDDSTSNGRNDRISITVAQTLTTSLRLLRVDRLTLSVFSPGAAFGNRKRRVQGRFAYHDANYWLWVTDPRYERAYLAKRDGQYEIGECYLTVSLGEPYNGACYKLIAAIIEKERS